ncbi:hypothetical protein [Haloferax elongans]|nr:hypothetical protein [Haloferax elongans]
MALKPEERPELVDTSVEDGDKRSEPMFEQFEQLFKLFARIRRN